MNKTSRRVVALGFVLLGACGGEAGPPARAIGATAGQPMTGATADAAAGAKSVEPPFSVGNGSTPGLLAGAGTGSQAPSAPAAGGGAAPAQPPSAAASTEPQRPRHPDLDPSIKFEWQETAPGMGAAKKCRAGTYTGTSQYLCMPVDAGFSDPGAGFGTELTATITLTLVESADGEFLQISDGEFSSLSADVFGLVAQLRGKLDCSTLAFTATTEDGGWGIGDPNTGVLPLGTFEAELNGTLDPDTGTLAGQWTITGSVPFVCMGPWSATLAH